jgi:hypothetical protein
VGVEELLQAHFTLALDGGELSALYRGSFIVCAKRMCEQCARLVLIGDEKNAYIRRGSYPSVFTTLTEPQLATLGRYLFVVFLRVSVAVVL